MLTSEESAIIRAYEDADYAQVVDLFIRINRELAPPEMHKRFELYIQTSVDGEMRRLVPGSAGASALGSDEIRNHPSSTGRAVWFDRLESSRLP
jgi:hypothetical protein